MSEISGYFLHTCFFWVDFYFFKLRIEGVCGRWGEGSQYPSGREEF